MTDAKVSALNRPPNAAVLWALALVAGQIFWIGLLYPLMPTTSSGWLVCTAMGGLASAWAVAGALAIRWLQRQQRHRLICKAAAVLIAVSLGLTIFLAALFGQSFLTRNFGYAFF